MGLKRLISRLDSGQSFGNDYPNTNTPSNVGGFNYGESISIFDGKIQNSSGDNLNDFFPFKQRSLGYGPQGTKDTTFMFGRLHGPAPYRKQNLPDLKPDKLGPGETGPILGVGGAIDAITEVGVRGGLVTALKRSVIDSLRIGEFLLSAKGLGFIAKNVGLQRTNPKLQEGPGANLLGLDLGGPNRIYNLGVNTLAQTLVNFGGLHVNRAGLLPIGAKNYEVEQGYRVDSNNKTKYEYNVRGVGPEEQGGSGNKTSSTSVYKGNRLASLYNKLVGNTSNNIEFFSGVEGPELYEFSGGPHSVYGIGKTRLKRYVYTERDALRAKKQQINQREGYKQSRHLGFKSGPKQQTSNQVIDFRRNRGVPYTNYDQKLGEQGQTLDSRFGHARGVVRMSTPTNKDGTINVRSSHPLADRINSTDIWTHQGPWDTTDLGSKVRDYIKFRIEAVDTDNPIISNTMVFRAFLDSFDDNYNSKWNEYNYNGRAEPFYTFGSFNRAISFSFKIAAFSRDDMRPLYRKLNYLVSQTAGEYSKTRLRGNFCRLTIGDYHSRLPGFFTSINLKWNKEYPWEIAMYQNGIGTQASVGNKNHTQSPQSQLVSGREAMLLDMARDRENKKVDEELSGNNIVGGDVVPITDFQGGSNIPEVNVNASGDFQDMDNDMLELPHILDVSCQFQPVHDFIPQKSIKDSPFILPKKYSKPDMSPQQDWLKWDPISQEERAASIAQAQAEEDQIEEDFKAYEKEQERLEREAEEKRQAELQAELDEIARQEEEEFQRMMEEEEFEEDFPEPWDDPIDPGNTPDPANEINVPGAGGNYGGGFGGGGLPGLPT